MSNCSQILVKHIKNTKHVLLEKYLPKSPSSNFMIVLLYVVSLGKLGEKILEIFYPFFIIH